MPKQIDTLLITGCSRGIGRALALKFSEENCTVYAVGRNQTDLNTLADLNKSIQPICADLTTAAGRETIYAALKDAPHFSIIHNAGTSKSTAFADLDEQSLRQHFELHFFAPLILTQHFLPQLQGQRILNISSGSALCSYPYKIPYCASKAAIHHAMGCLQAEYVQKNVGFANLRPGMVDTAMQKALRSESIPGSEFYVKAHKDGALLAPETVAQFAYWVMHNTDNETFNSTFWEIENKEHQQQWLH